MLLQKGTVTEAVAGNEGGGTAFVLLYIWRLTTAKSVNQLSIAPQLHVRHVPEVHPASFKD